MTDDVREKARETAFHFAGYFNVGEDSERAFRETAEKYVESALSAARNTALEEACAEIRGVLKDDHNKTSMFPHGSSESYLFTRRIQERCDALKEADARIRALKDKE